MWNRASEQVQLRGSVGSQRFGEAIMVAADVSAMVMMATVTVKKVER